MLSTLLDLAGAIALTAFVWFIWPPACLLVVGLAFLAASWKAAR